MNWDELATVLRDEVAKYGTLFQQLENQRIALIEQDPPGIIEASLKLEQCMADLDALHTRREEVVSSLKHALGYSQETTITGMLEKAQPAHAPLIEERLREVNRLIKESRRYLASSRTLCRKAWETGAAILAALGHQQSAVFTYSDRGLARPVSAATGPYKTQLI